MHKRFHFPAPTDLPRQPELPDPRWRLDGEHVTSVNGWPAQRAYLKAMLTTYQYGHMPPNQEVTTSPLRACKRRDQP